MSGTMDPARTRPEADAQSGEQSPLGRDTVLRRLVAVGAGLVTIYVILLTGQRALDAYRMRQQVDAVRQEIAKLQARNVALQSDLAGGRAEEDVERIARQELGLVKPGDHPVALVWPAGQPPAEPPAPAPTLVVEPAWRAWLREALEFRSP